MKKAIGISGAVITLLIMTGCGKSVPACSDQETQGLVGNIVKGKLIEMAGYADPSMTNKIETVLDGIRTTNQNADTGSQECAAKLTVKNFGFFGGDRSLDITYKVEATDDGKQFYVTVFGL